MSPVIIRLLKGVQPLWLLGAPVTLLVLAVMDVAWLAKPSAWAGSMWICGASLVFVPSAPHFARFPVWRVLPVSSADRRRAKWWVCLGLPLSWMLLAMTAAVSATLAIHRLRPPLIDIAEALSVQVLAATAMVAIFGGASSLLRPRTLRGVGTLLGIVLLGTTLGVVFVRLDESIVLIAMGILALVLALAASTSADRIGEASQGPVDIQEGPVDTAAAAAAMLQAGAARQGASGWAALAPYGLRSAAFAFGAGAAASYWPLAQQHVSLAESASSLAAQTVLLVLIVTWAIGGSGTVRAVRALRALPIGAVALTAILQGFVLAVAAGAFAGIWAVYWAAGGDIARLRLLLWVAIPILALRLPMDFRFGDRWARWLYITPIVLVSLAGLIPDSVWHEAMAAGLVLTTLIWAWTWWEIARGRGAYRAQPVRVTRWRNIRG